MINKFKNKFMRISINVELNLIAKLLFSKNIKKSKRIEEKKNSKFNIFTEWRKSPPTMIISCQMYLFILKNINIVLDDLTFSSLTGNLNFVVVRIKFNFLIFNFFKHKIILDILVVEIAFERNNRLFLFY